MERSGPDSSITFHFGLFFWVFVRYGEALGTVVQLCLPNEFYYSDINTFFFFFDKFGYK